MNLHALYEYIYIFLKLVSVVYKFTVYNYIEVNGISIH